MTLYEKRKPTYGLDGKENNAKYWEKDVKKFIRKRIRRYCKCITSGEFAEECDFCIGMREDAGEELCK